MEQNPGWKQARPENPTGAPGRARFSSIGATGLERQGETPRAQERSRRLSPCSPRVQGRGSPHTCTVVLGVWIDGPPWSAGRALQHPETQGSPAAAPQMRARLLHLFSPKLRTPASQNRTPSRATSCAQKQKWGVGYRHPTPSQTRHRSRHRPSGPGGRIGAALGRAGGGEGTPRVRAPAGIQPRGSRLPPKTVAGRSDCSWGRCPGRRFPSRRAWTERRVETVLPAAAGLPGKTGGEVGLGWV